MEKNMKIKLILSTILLSFATCSLQVNAMEQDENVKNKVDSLSQLAAEKSAQVLLEQAVDHLVVKLNTLDQKSAIQTAKLFINDLSKKQQILLVSKLIISRPNREYASDLLMLLKKDYFEDVFNHITANKSNKSIDTLKALIYHNGKNCYWISFYLKNLLKNNYTWTYSLFDEFLNDTAHHGLASTLIEVTPKAKDNQDLYNALKNHLPRTAQFLEKSDSELLTKDLIKLATKILENDFTEFYPWIQKALPNHQWSTEHAQKLLASTKTEE